jgi:hypothetical protein
VKTYVCIQNFDLYPNKSSLLKQSPKENTHKRTDNYDLLRGIISALSFSWKVKDGAGILCSNQSI